MAQGVPNESVLSVKVKSTTTGPVAPVPADPTISFGKDCPKDAIDNRNCFNGNTGYKSLEAAWNACGDME